MRTPASYVHNRHKTNSLHRVHVCRFTAGDVIRSYNSRVSSWRSKIAASKLLHRSSEEVQFPLIILRCANSSAPLIYNITSSRNQQGWRPALTGVRIKIAVAFSVRLFPSAWLWPFQPSARFADTAAAPA